MYDYGCASNCTRPIRLMRYLPILTVLVAAALSPASAQRYPDQDVTVNPAATGTQLLLYPGGKYGRVVHGLRMPGEKNDGPIHLRMPASHHPARRSIAQPAETAPDVAAATTPVRHHIAKAQPTPPPEPIQTPAANTSDLESMAAAEPVKPAPVKRRAHRTEPPPETTAAPQQRIANMEPPKRAPKPQPAATAEPAAQIPLTPQTMHIASLTPPPARSVPSRKPAAALGGSKRSVIIFAAGATDPAVSAVQSVKALAGDLTASLSEGGARVQLLAYGGHPGDKSSDTRRLSLKRALIIRQLLIDNGVPSERIDVRAMGGIDDTGPPDRVDVFVRS